MTDQKALQSWVVRGENMTIVRDNGVLLYEGPDKDMPDDIRKIANEMTVNPLDAFKRKDANANESET